MDLLLFTTTDYSACRAVTDKQAKSFFGHTDRHVSAVHSGLEKPRYFLYLYDCIFQPLGTFPGPTEALFGIFTHRLSGCLIVELPAAIANH